MANMKHAVEGCDVCLKQVKRVTLKDKSRDGQNLSFPQDKLLQKINLPEIKNDGVVCKSCQIHPIIGNTFRCFTCKDFICCESCYDSKNHEHTLIYISSKLEKL